MDIHHYLQNAKRILSEIPFKNLADNGLKVDRVNDNPEAARYFMMFADWKKVTFESIFEAVEHNTAAHTQIYVDFVFCKTLCDFCAFYGVVPRNEQEMYEYVNYLKKEIQLIKRFYFDKGFYADALEFGGGTPTFLPLSCLKDITDFILKELPFLKEHEFNFEASPETLVGEEGVAKLEYLRDVGANRMSIGIQSFDEKVLKVTNRPHNVQDIHEAIKNAQLVGFSRINADLMIGLCEQTIESFLVSLAQTIEYQIDIIEIYAMRYFDTKEFVPMQGKYVSEQKSFLSHHDILLGRIAAHLMLADAQYISSNGRTYERKNSSYNFYSMYYDGNFRGKNTLGLGRKSNSNIYPWQYANYRNMDKYYHALDCGKLPIATGALFNDKSRVAKLLTGMFQLPQSIDIDIIKEKHPKGWDKSFDELFDLFVKLGLLINDGHAYTKTFLGFLFIEEMLKKVYDVAVTPFNISSLFLGKQQVPH